MLHYVCINVHTDTCSSLQDHALFYTGSLNLIYVTLYPT